MAFDWKEFLALARAVTGQSSSSYSVEASDRTAVSRAYYAAFCFARNCAKSKYGFLPSNRAKDHALLRDNIKQTHPGVDSRLNRLRQWRNQCDYEDRVSNVNSMVKQALSDASWIIQKC